MVGAFEKIFFALFSTKFQLRLIEAKMNFERNVREPS